MANKDSYPRNRPTGRTEQSKLLSAARIAAKAAGYVLAPTAMIAADAVAARTRKQREANERPLTPAEISAHKEKMRLKGRDKSRPRFEGDTEGQLRKGPTIDETVRSAVTAMEEGIGKVRKKRQEQKQKKTKQLRKDVASGKYGIT